MATLRRSSIAFFVAGLIALFAAHPAPGQHAGFIEVFPEGLPPGTRAFDLTFTIVDHGPYTTDWTAAYVKVLAHGDAAIVDPVHGTTVPWSTFQHYFSGVEADTFFARYNASPTYGIPMIVDWSVDGVDWPDTLDGEYSELICGWFDTSTVKIPATDTLMRVVLSELDEGMVTLNGWTYIGSDQMGYAFQYSVGVPEPAASAMLLLGLLAAGRRRPETVTPSRSIRSEIQKASPRYPAPHRHGRSFGAAHGPPALTRSGGMHKRRRAAQVAHAAQIKPEEMLNGREQNQSDRRKRR